MLGSVIAQTSADAGSHQVLLDVAGRTIRRWDDRGNRLRTTFDPVGRPRDLFVKIGAAAEFLGEHAIYAESPDSTLTRPQARDRNLLGRVFQQQDAAGLTTNARCDFKGNVLEVTRKFIANHRQAPDWSQNPALGAETFSLVTEYDALNRARRMTTPDGSVTRSEFDDGRMLRQVHVAVGGAAEQPFVDEVLYDAKGQRQSISYQNGAHTTYTYDPQTLRLQRLVTTRELGAVTLQDLRYTYDPVGNVCRLEDAAPDAMYFNGAIVRAVSQYRYDALYQLREAKGREHSGPPAANDAFRPQYDSDDVPRIGNAQPTNGNLMRNYREEYDYDAAGNISRVFHDAGGQGNWTRNYAYAADSNRLLATTLPNDPLAGVMPVRYAYDAHGNLTSMPHLSRLEWDHKDALREVQLDDQRVAYYVYNAAGQRVMKVIERNGQVVEQRLYLGAYEVYRRLAAGVVRLERQTLHVADGAFRIAVVETKTVDLDDANGLNVPVTRYHLGNLLGSVVLELDDQAAIISFEEFYPFGGTSFRSGRSAAETSLKRYRYCGKERDDETGLYYHGARYYVPWLGRWTTPDPVGLTGGVNLYAYCQNNPATLHDPSGHQPNDPLDILQFVRNQAGFESGANWSWNRVVVGSESIRDSNSQVRIRTRDQSNGRHRRR